jgi:acyl-CoA synthetase (AMP-forming)/AMP-acid ligase II
MVISGRRNQDGNARRFAMIFRSPYPDVEIPNVSLADFVLRHAERLADKPALIDAASGRSLTYGQLAGGIRGVAAGLWERGLRKGDVVGIFAPNDPDYAIALYAVASAGGIVTTVNPQVTAEELARQLDDSRARFLVTTPDLLCRAREAAGSMVQEIVVMGEAEGAISLSALGGTKAAVPSVPIDPFLDTVVLPYSSGTTGLPKGVMLTHRNLVANVCQVSVPQAGDETEIVFAVPPFYHIYGTLLLDLALANGWTLLTLPRFDLASFLRALQDYRVTRASVAPPVVLALANEPIVEGFNLSSLRFILSGGAPLDHVLIRRCEARLGCLVAQGFGMTEASPATHVQAPDGNVAKRGSVGPCVPNTECKVVDFDSGAELGPGEQGELWVRGPQVMKGYLNRPDATAQIITPDGWLRTGDLVCLDDDGYLFVVDRLKELIKYKGYQVAPAELEAVLLTHPAVADAAVVPSPDEEAGEVPKAFVVLRKPSTADDLIAYVAARVAPYKKVRRLEITDQIPKSPSGKILRRVLVERERAAALVPA